MTIIAAPMEDTVVCVSQSCKKRAHQRGFGILWALGGIAAISALAVTLTQWTQVSIQNQKSKNVDAILQVKEAILLHTLYFEELCSPLVANLALPTNDQSVLVTIPPNHLLRSHLKANDSLFVEKSSTGYKLKWNSVIGRETEFRHYALEIQNLGNLRSCRGQKLISSSDLRCPEGQFITRLSPDGTYFSCQSQATNQMQGAHQCPTGQYFVGFDPNGQAVCRSSQDLIQNSAVQPANLEIRNESPSSCQPRSTDHWALVLEQKIQGSWVVEPTAIAFSYQIATNRGCRLGFGDQQGNSDARPPFEVNQIEYGNPNTGNFRRLTFGTVSLCFRARCRIPLQNTGNSFNDASCPAGHFEDPISWTHVAGSDSQDFQKVWGKVQTSYDTSSQTIRNIQTTIETQLKSNQASQTRFKLYKRTILESPCAGSNP